jgi:hypothetical protein
VRKLAVGVGMWVEKGVGIKRVAGNRTDGGVSTIASSPTDGE